MSRRQWLFMGGIAAATLLAFAGSFGLAQERGGGQKVGRGLAPQVNRWLGQLPLQPALRGIEKKDIRRGMVIAKPNARLVFVYDGEETPDGVATALARVTTPEVVAKIAPQLLESAPGEVARSGPGMVQGGQSSLIFVTARKNADCDQPGCVKSEYSCFCYRLLDIDKIVLQPYPDEDPEFTPRPIVSPTGSPEGGGGGGGRLAAPSAPGRTVVIILGESLQAKLADPKWWARNRGWFQKEVVAKIVSSPTQGNLTIKTKSSPP